jgi:hypothetical protein
MFCLHFRFSSNARVRIPFWKTSRRARAKLPKWYKHTTSDLRTSIAKSMSGTSTSTASLQFAKAQLPHRSMFSNGYQIDVLNSSTTQAGSQPPKNSLLGRMPSMSEKRAGLGHGHMPYFRLRAAHESAAVRWEVTNWFMSCSGTRLMSSRFQYRQMVYTISFASRSEPRLCVIRVCLVSQGRKDAEWTGKNLHRPSFEFIPDKF